MSKSRTITCLITCSLLVFLGCATESQKVSKPGEYSGYSCQVYDEAICVSQYISVRDGTKLAADIVRPAEKRKPSKKAWPVIWALTPYFRAEMKEGQRTTEVLDRWKEFVKYGYVVACVDTRGRGASYGTRRGVHDRTEAWDAYDVTEWFANQPWCDGNVGMWGCSYLGIIQYMCATTRPPHLKAIFPGCCDFDKYGCFCEGGIYQDVGWIGWADDQKSSDLSMDAVPVDQDHDRSMLSAAVAQHVGNHHCGNIFRSMPYRNSWSKETNSLFWFESSATSYHDQIERWGGGIYHRGAWYDGSKGDTILSFVNMQNPGKLLLGPWLHCETESEFEFDLQAEYRRWYDFWLKGIDNGIMTEPPIYYYTMGAPEGQAWRFAQEWPLQNEKPTEFFFNTGRSGSVNSINDGTLTIQPPEAGIGKDDYIVDYSCNSPCLTYEMSREDMGANDTKGLTYTSQPLPANVEVTGFPVIHLWISSTAVDGDFYAFLEEIDPDGYSHYVAMGQLRASHRATHVPNFDNLGLPWHRSLMQDVSDLVPGQPTELVFSLQPTSNVFNAGQRLRVTITCSEKDVSTPRELAPPPTVTLYRNKEYTSYITLPIIPQKKG